MSPLESVILGAIALALMAYLAYTLVRPDRF